MRLNQVSTTLIQSHGQLLQKGIFHMKLVFKYPLNILYTGHYMNPEVDILLYSHNKIAGINGMLEKSRPIQARTHKKKFFTIIFQYTDSSS